MTDGRSFGTVFTGSSSALFARSVIKADVVHLMPAVQAAEHLKRADTASASGRMQEIGLYPENSHPSDNVEERRPYTKLNDASSVRHKSKRPDRWTRTPGSAIASVMTDYGKRPAARAVSK